MDNVVFLDRHKKPNYRSNVYENLKSFSRSERLAALKTMSEINKADIFTLKGIADQLFYSYADGLKAFGTVFTEKHIIIFKVATDKKGTKIVTFLSVVNTCRLFIRKRKTNHSIIEGEFIGSNDRMHLHSGIDTNNILHWYIIDFVTGSSYPFILDLEELYNPFIKDISSFEPVKVA